MTAIQMFDDDVSRFRGIVEQRLGLYFDEGKRDFLAGVLSSRLEKNRESGEDYLQRLGNGAPSAEWSALGQLLTVPETYFFRHYDQFRAFAEVALVERMRAQAACRRLNILSLGCASGEEPYSLAVMAREAAMEASWEISIVGVDINPAVLEKAAIARYGDWALRETPPAIRQKWFRRQGRDYLVDASILGAVRFEERNLAADDPYFWRPGMYDIIFCRNMMMYFSPESASALVGRIARSLAPGGYLFLGHAETLRGLSQDFHLCHSHETFYYRRRSGDEAASGYGASIAASVELPPSLATVLEGEDAWIDAIQASSQRIRALAEANATKAGNAVTGAPSRGDLKDAFALLREERFSEALAAVRLLPATMENDADTLLLKAVLYAHSGNLGGAEQVCRDLLDIDELNAGARYVLALCCEGRGDHRAAVEHDQAAVYLDPGFAMPHLHLGLLARRAGDLESARRELKQALALLQREDSSRLLLFGGGFGRDTLLVLCRAEFTACGGQG